MSETDIANPGMLDEAVRRDILRDGRQQKGGEVEKFKVDLDLIDIQSFFTGHVVGPGHMSILVHDVSSGFVRPFGALRVMPDQWEKMKLLGDMLIKRHLALLAEAAQCDQESES